MYRPCKANASMKLSVHLSISREAVRIEGKKPRSKGTPMRRVIVNNSVTLDGVMQAPGRPDEDTRGGFEHGGWALSYSDPVMGQVAGASMAAAPDLLFGRRT